MHGMHFNGAVYVGNLAARVRPNMESVNRRATRRIVLSLLLIPLAIGVLVTGIVMSVNSDTFGPSPLIFVGMGCIFFSFVLASVMGALKIAPSKIVTLMNEVRANEKVALDSLSLSAFAGPAQVSLVVKRLIETGNLSGYELIGDVGVARTSIMARESDFESTPRPQRRNNRNQGGFLECRECGEDVIANSSFCNHCGEML